MTRTDDAGWQTARLEWGPVELRAIGARRGDLPVLVFLHEGLGAAAHWKDFPDAVAAATGLPAIVYSRYGYGGSGPAPLPRPVAYMHVEGQEVLPALLAALDIERPILVGHSDGASIALIHAAMPERNPLALVLEAPHVFVEDLSLAGIRDAKTAYEAGSLKSALERWHQDVEGAFRGWNDIWLNPDFRAWNIEGVLKMIRCPILQIQGRDDAYGTAAQLQSIEVEAGGPVQTVMLDACGHAPHRDQRAAVEQAMTAFIRRVVG